MLKLFEWFEDDKKLYIVTERCKGGELFDRIVEESFFPEYEAAIIFRQILQSLNYLHKNNIAHRDLKPENFLFDSKAKDSDLKIIDFGLSRILKSDSEAFKGMTSGVATGATTVGGKKKMLEKMNTKAGTPSYVSPEVLAGNYGLDCDMWSAGCILYILLCGYTPFYGDDDYELCQNVLKGDFDMGGEEWDDISKEAKQLVKALITKPEKRLTAQEALDHKWFKKVLKNEKKYDIKDLKAQKQLNAFNAFGDNTKLTQAALTAISVQVNPDEITELKNLFKALDLNGDGTLSLSELESGLEGHDNKKQIMSLLKAADTDGSGDINYTEFIAATLDQNIFMNEMYIR